MSRHDPFRLSVVILSAVLFLGLTAFNLYELFFGGEDLFGPRLGLVPNTSDTSEVYLLDTTPATPAFLTWAVLYVWNFLWVVYSFTTLCRSTSFGYLYMAPDGGVIPLATYLCFSLAVIFLTVFLQVWRLYYIVYSTPLLALCALCLYVALIMSYRRLGSARESLASEGSSADVWCIRVLLHNGMSVFATWITIATVIILLNATLAYRAGLLVELSSTICLAILAAAVLIYGLVENTVFRQHTLYTVTPYLVVAFALICSIERNWNPTKRNSIFTVAILALDGIFLLVKFVMIIVAGVRNREPENKKYSF